MNSKVSVRFPRIWMTALGRVERPCRNASMANGRAECTAGRVRALREAQGIRVIGTAAAPSSTKRRGSKSEPRSGHFVSC
jgi:hypothetical protein